MIKTVFKTSIIALFSITSLLGCSTMRSEYQQPELAIPENWAQSDSLANSSESERVERPDKWWTLFSDPELNRLVDQVLVVNSDLEKATLTLRKALLEAGINENNKIPKLSFSQDSSYAVDLDSNDSQQSFGTSLSLSYELDLWNRIDALADAGELAAKASYEDRERLAQDLIVTTSMLYWKIGYLNQRQALIQQNISDTKRVAQLTQNKFDVGATTRLEVVESKQALFNHQVQLSQLQQELSEAKNSISILLNQPLQDSGISIAQLPDEPIPNIEAGLPSDLLLRRPDVKASLYTLKSALANKDAVDSSYMPTFTLTGALNTSSSNLVELLQNPVAKLGSGIVLPFLQWNEMELKKSISEVDYQMAVVDYRDTIYQAFEEVANLLTAKEHFTYQDAVYQEQYANAQEIESIYKSRYDYGESDIIDWINVMESRRNVETSILENRFNQFVTQVKLYQSLGGGDIAPEDLASKDLASEDLAH